MGDAMSEQPLQFIGQKPRGEIVTELELLYFEMDGAAFSISLNKWTLPEPSEGEKKDE
jgi:hypothetical protein